MLRGFTTFKCDKCGNKFKAADIEFLATAFSQPMKCPKCGSFHTKPIKLFPYNLMDRFVYKKIWKMMDECQEEQDVQPQEFLNL